MESNWTRNLMAAKRADTQISPNHHQHVTTSSTSIWHILMKSDRTLPCMALAPHQLVQRIIILLTTPKRNYWIFLETFPVLEPVKMVAILTNLITLKLKLLSKILQITIHKSAATASLAAFKALLLSSRTLPLRSQRLR
jgi:hypothetical protein